MIKTNTVKQLQKIEQVLEETRKLYEQLKESYALNKAFVDQNSDESVRQIINNELDKIKTLSNNAQHMVEPLKEGYDFITSAWQNNQTRIQYVQKELSDKILEDIQEKLEYFNSSYQEIFQSPNGDLSEKFIEKYKEIDELYNKLFLKQPDEKSKIDELDEKIENFLEKYAELIENDENKTKYDIFIEKNKDFENKKNRLDEFYTRIFGNQEKNIKSLKNELENRQEELKKIEEEARKVINLSSDAGLAGGFYQRAKSARNNKWVSLGIFVLILVIMGYFNFQTIDFQNLKEIDLLSVVVRFMINIPFIWIATVANLNLNKYTKLEQEYAHKESLARSFERYKAAIGELNEDEEEEMITMLMKTNIDI